MTRLIASLIVVAALGCHRTAPDTMDRDVFVDVMTNLRRAVRTYPESTTFDVHRDEILREAGVTDSMLVAFIRAHGDDPAFMAEAWDSIDARINPTENPDTVR